MKNKKVGIVIIIAAVIYIIAFNDNEEKSRNEKSVSTTTEKEAKWYEGGTLHKSKISNWKKATDRNKLATCADFIAGLDKSVSLSVLKIEANELKDCVDEATRGLDELNNEDVATIASTCLILMGYQ